MNIHSVRTSLASIRHADPARAGKRDAILRAAIDVFAERGYFTAQVADVARAAGIAAGTVYLYFRSKDDILVSIFERTMSEAPRLVRSPSPRIDAAKMVGNMIDMKKLDSVSAASPMVPPTIAAIAQRTTLATPKIASNPAQRFLLS